MTGPKCIIREFLLLCIRSSAQKDDNFGWERNKCAAEAHNRPVHRRQHSADNLHCYWRWVSFLLKLHLLVKPWQENTWTVGADCPNIGWVV